MLIEQRSEEWFQLRRGKITSSEIHKIMGEKGLTETAKTYLLEKVCEHFGGVTEPAHGQALEWGTELEPVAIEHYEQVTGTKVEKASFIAASEYYGGSPDGIVKPKGVIEVKCPFKSANHFKHGMIDSPAKFKKVAPNYYYQCISNMICADATWCDFISFDPRVSSDYRMFIYRLELDKGEVKLINERIELAVEYMKGLEKEIKQAKPKLLLG
jgi:putative phage-type endonuclease